MRLCDMQIAARLPMQAFLRDLNVGLARFLHEDPKWHDVESNGRVEAGSEESNPFTCNSLRNEWHRGRVRPM